jgi:acyl carrier protein
MSGSDQDVEVFLMQQLAACRGESEDQVQAAILAAGGIDSLEGVELILAAEEEYGVEIPDDALSPEVCSSLSELAALIGSKMVR